MSLLDWLPSIKSRLILITQHFSLVVFELRTRRTLSTIKPATDGLYTKRSKLVSTITIDQWTQVEASTHRTDVRHSPLFITRRSVSQRLVVALVRKCLYLSCPLHVVLSFVVWLAGRMISFYQQPIRLSNNRNISDYLQQNQGQHHKIKSISRIKNGLWDGKLSLISRYAFNEFCQCSLP